MTRMPINTEDLIKKYGEEYRALIISALKWLEASEPAWGLDRPIKQDIYIRDLIAAAKKGN